MIYFIRYKSDGWKCTKYVPRKSSRVSKVITCKGILKKAMDFISYLINNFLFVFCRDAYYRYEAAAANTPRAMGPPGGYPRHRPPHPLQQQPQYPSYQPPTENLYAMGADQHSGMGMGDLGGWGSAPAPPPAQAGYPGSALGAYGHPQTAPSPQRQPQAQGG